MSEFNVVAVEITSIREHTNANLLEIVGVHGGYPVVVRKGTYEIGDLAVHVPIDSLVETGRPEFAFLAEGVSKPKPIHRVKAACLRNVVSMGLLIPAPEGAKVGDDLQEFYGIKKWEPQIDLRAGGENEKGPAGYIFPIYTDIEGLRKYKEVLSKGEEVAVHEKIHGCQGRWFFDGTRLWTGSHKCIKKEQETNLWWKVAYAYNLEEKLAKYPMCVFYGEPYGQVQDLRYGIEKGVKCMFYDIFSLEENRYLNHDEVVYILDKLELSMVPEIYRGGWLGFDKMEELAEGNSLVKGAEHIREGFVVKPVMEKWDDKCGRVIFKLVSQKYLLRK